MNSDDYYPRECECGHRQHMGPCGGTHILHYPPGQVPAGATGKPCPWNEGCTVMVTKPCHCRAFREVDGADEMLRQHGL